MQQSPPKKKRFRKAPLILLLLIAMTAAFLIHQNNAIQTTHPRFASKELPSEFDGFRIAHISDLHNARFGPDNSWLLNRLRDEKPDIITITGDLIDSRHTDIPLAMQFIGDAAKIAPVYVVSGNHESRGLYAQWEEGLAAAGAVNLDGKTQAIEKNGSRLYLLGLADPAVSGDALFQEKLDSYAQIDGFRVLLSHRPARIGQYAGAGIELVLCGHAHGGQVRLPLIGALFAPDEGILPKYSSGLYTQGESSMYVSRGLGNSRFPFRVFNRPELAILELAVE